MPPLTRSGDISSGHDTYPDSIKLKGSSNTIANGKSIHRIGDESEKHTNDVGHTHKRFAVVGSTNVLINGLGVVRIGDAINCGGISVNGSENSIVN